MKNIFIKHRPYISVLWYYKIIITPTKLLFSTTFGGYIKLIFTAIQCTRQLIFIGRNEILFYFLSRHTVCKPTSKWFITLNILVLTLLLTLYLTNIRWYKTGISSNRSTKENPCASDFLKNHIMTGMARARTGNVLFQVATLIATAKNVCYTPILPDKPVAHFDNIFDLDNVKRINLNIGSFRRNSEPAVDVYDVNLISKINPAYNWTLNGYRWSFKYFEARADLVRSSFKFKEKIRKDVKHYISF